jgi:hypothetical protein
MRTEAMERPAIVDDVLKAKRALESTGLERTRVAFIMTEEERKQVFEYSHSNTYEPDPELCRRIGYTPPPKPKDDGGPFTLFGMKIATVKTRMEVVL